MCILEHSSLYGGQKTQCYEWNGEGCGWETCPPVRPVEPSKPTPTPHISLKTWTGSGDQTFITVEVSTDLIGPGEFLGQAVVFIYYPRHGRSPLRNPLAETMIGRKILKTTWSRFQIDHGTWVCRSKPITDQSREFGLRGDCPTKVNNMGTFIAFP